MGSKEMLIYNRERRAGKGAWSSFDFIANCCYAAKKEKKKSALC
jgi:hypothetical protein